MIEEFSASPHTVGCMITILSALVSLLSFRIRSRAWLELEFITLRHQVIAVRRQRPRHLRLFLADRLFWVWLYRVRPQLLNTLVLVEPATVIGWHRKGFRIQWRSRSGRSKWATRLRSHRENTRVRLGVR
jgi:putative transposase